MSSYKQLLGLSNLGLVDSALCNFNDLILAVSVRVMHFTVRLKSRCEKSSKINLKLATRHACAYDHFIQGVKCKIKKNAPHIVFMNWAYTTHNIHAETVVSIRSLYYDHS